MTGFNISDTLEIIKRLQTILALIQGFTGRAAELGDEARVGRATARAFHCFFFSGEPAFVFGGVFWRSDAVGPQSLFSRGIYPIGGPGRRVNGMDGDVAKAQAL